MRSFECKLSTEAKWLVLDALLKSGRKITIRRKESGDGFLREEWWIGGLAKGDWMNWNAASDGIVWTVAFGFDAAEIISDVMRTRSDCQWIWPEGGFSE